MIHIQLNEEFTVDTLPGTFRLAPGRLVVAGGDIPRIVPPSEGAKVADKVEEPTTHRSGGLIAAMREGIGF